VFVQRALRLAAGGRVGEQGSEGGDNLPRVWGGWAQELPVPQEPPRGPAAP
jgi:hypothetical protein